MQKYSLNSVLAFAGKAGAAVLFLAFVTYPASAQQKSKSSSAPAKSAASAAHPPSNGSHPSAASAGMSGAHPGASASHSGPTANGPHANSSSASASHGPTANGSHTAGGTGANTSHATPGAGANSHAAGGGNKTATGSPAPKGSHTVATKNGAVTRRADGRVSDVHDAKRGMDIHHGLDGGKKVSVERGDHSRLVAERGRRGYIERRYSYGGRDYARRSYYWQGHEYNRYYRGYYYNGVYMNVYAPGYYYGPGFYGWAYNPWPAPVAFGWGWGGAPWYGYYGAYFSPYPVYAGPSLWLTDYLISNELAAAYAAAQANQAAAAAVQPGDGLTPDVKAEIAAEVQSQIALENAEAQQNARGQDVDPASSSIARLMSDGKPHVFVAGTGLDVVAADGSECALTEGDAVQLSQAPPAGADSASVAVLSSKGGKECPRGSNATVQLADLQEMQNHMRETIDQGMQELQAKQGTGGLPAAPPSARTPPVQTAFAQNAPPAEQNGAADINQQMQTSNQVDQDTQASPIGGLDSAATPAASPAAAPVSISLGQSIAQVTAALGQPQSVIDLGTKKIYKYKDMKVTFRAGKVSDVE